MQDLKEYILEKKKKGLLYMPYLTVGDPGFGDTVDFGIAMIDAGAAILELGIPFSDPTADGPVIQAAMVRALSHRDFSLEKVFSVARAIHEARPETPLVFLSYINPVLAGFATKTQASEAKPKVSASARPSSPTQENLSSAPGNASLDLEGSLRRFLKECQGSGVRGLVVPDLPFDTEESELLRQIAPEYGVNQILLVAPNTSEARLQKICEAAEGFIYYVTSLGVTGVRKELPADLKDRVERVRRLSGVPVLAGFGIGKPEQVLPLRGILDGAIVGSLNHRIIAEANGSAKDRLKETTAAFVRACSD